MNDLELITAIKKLQFNSSRYRAALELIANGKPDRLDHSEDVARLERAIKIAKNALRS